MTTANRPPEIDTINQDSARAAAGDLWLDVQAALNAAPNIADTRGNGEIGQKEIANFFSTSGVRFVREADLAPLADVFNVSEAIQEIARKCDEHEHLRGRKFAVYFWVKPSVSKGRVKLGLAGAYSAKDRALWPSSPVPWFKMGISLPYWLLAGDLERLRLIHHEMGHCDIEIDNDGIPRPFTAPHDVEEFASTIGRFGPMGELDAKLIASALPHSTWPAWQSHFERHQGELFPSWGT